jgi:hypothetical protein
MPCITVPNGIVCMAKIDFHCPHCSKEYSDADEKYIKRFLNNKCGYTKIKCDCGKVFGMTYDMKGDAVGFKLTKKL